MLPAPSKWQVNYSGVLAPVRAKPSGLPVLPDSQHGDRIQFTVVVAQGAAGARRDGRPHPDRRGRQGRPDQRDPGAAARAGHLRPQVGFLLVRGRGKAGVLVKV